MPLTVAGGALTVETAELQGDLHTLLPWADEHGVRLDGLNATQASLQEVFLELAPSMGGS